MNEQGGTNELPNSIEVNADTEILPKGKDYNTEPNRNVSQTHT